MSIWHAALLILLSLAPVTRCYAQDFCPGRHLQLRNAAGGSSLATSLVAYFKFDESAAPWHNAVTGASSTANGGVCPSTTCSPVTAAKIGANALNCGGPFFTELDFPGVESCCGGASSPGSGSGSGTDFTINLWVLGSAQGNGFPLIASMPATPCGGGGYLGWVINDDGAGHIQLRVYGGTQAGVQQKTTVQSTAVVLNSAWHMVTVGYDHTITGGVGPSGGGIWIMVDGAGYTSSANQTGATPEPNNIGCVHNSTSGCSVGNLCVANYTDHPNVAFAGTLDEIGIWMQRSLSQSDVVQLYNSGAGMRPPGI